jgi:uncharacterized protein (TIGR02246 family)
MDDEQLIRDLVRSWMDATKAGNTPAVLDLMTEDVVFLRPGHPPMRKAEFAAGAEAQQAGQAPRFDGASEIQEIEVLGEWAYMWTKLTVVATPPDGSAPMKPYANDFEEGGRAVEDRAGREHAGARLGSGLETSLLPLLKRLDLREFFSQRVLRLARVVVDL